MTRGVLPVFSRFRASASGASWIIDRRDVQPRPAGCPLPLEGGVVRLERRLDPRRAGPLDQVDLDRRRRPVLERQPQRDRQHGREAVDPEDPRRLAVEVAEPDQVELEERRGSQHGWSVVTRYGDRLPRLRPESGFRIPNPDVRSFGGSPHRNAGCRLTTPGCRSRGRADAIATLLPRFLRPLGAAPVVGSSSRRWRPVSETKTSSRLTCRVVRRASGRPVGSSSSSKAGIARCGSATVSDVAVVLGPGGEDRVEPEERIGLERRPARPRARTRRCGRPPAGRSARRAIPGR